MKKFLKPSKLTWIIFFTIIFIVILNAITINAFNFGSEILMGIFFFIPLAFFKFMGLDISAKTGWLEIPTLLGNILVIFFDIVLVYLISFMIFWLFNEFKKERTLKITSHFPASKKVVFELLKDFKTLKKIAYPYITFKPLDDNENFTWEKGKISVFKTKLFGIIPFGIHKINVIEFNDKKIYTNEQNTYVKIWNHEILLKELSKKETKYTDIVQINAGWKTYFVYIWAKFFYKHRQKKWIKMIRDICD